MKTLRLFIIFSCLGIGTTKAQYTDLVNFTGDNGAGPVGSLTFSGGLFYGLTQFGGIYDSGVIFSYDPVGYVYTDLVSFTSIGWPLGSLTLSGGVFYGMTSEGGANSNGVIFSYDPIGNVYTDLINFTGTGGSNPGRSPQGSLTLSGGVFYGITEGGGATGYGVIFSYNPVGNVYTSLVNFTGTSGSNPGGFSSGSLTLSGGVFYGMTSEGGAKDSGVIFSYDPVGNVYTDLINFTGTGGSNPGAWPFGSLTFSGGILYGMTAYGGVNDSGVIFSYDPVGNVYTDLVNFTGTSGSNPGGLPAGSLTLSGGTLYGMTSKGGANDNGVIFSYDPVGNLYTDLVNFTGTGGSNPGAWPFGSLALSGGIFYGMTEIGGATDNGVIFSFKDTTTVINNMNTGAGIKLFPNPNNGGFTIQSFSNQSSVTIYNLLGEKVLTQTLSAAPVNNSINISDQPDGVYLYRILDEGGGLLNQGNIVIER